MDECMPQPFKASMKFMAAILGTPIAEEYQPCWRPTPPPRHGQCALDQTGLHVRLQTPAHHLAVEQVYHRSQVQGVFNWSSQHLNHGGVYGKTCGVDAEVDGARSMRSPGAPSLRCEFERRFWEQIATGITSERAAEAVGVSTVIGSRWFPHRGGMPFLCRNPYLGGTCRSRSEKRSRCSGPKASGCARSLAV